MAISRRDAFKMLAGAASVATLPAIFPSDSLAELHDLISRSHLPKNVWTADNGDGTYKNPLLFGDWPDPDVIRVGDDFYFVSTSMHFVPGCPILHSKDLVNWEMAGYAVDRYTEDPCYNMQGGTMYLNGSWAATIRYHNGLFYVGFCTPKGLGTKEGHFSICIAKSVAGPWKRTIFPEYLYDPGLVFDDDGKVYVVHGQGKLYVTGLAADACSVKEEAKLIWDKPIPKPSGSSASYHSYGMEGSHAYKINGYYYITCPAGGTEGWQMCLRSRNIYGPYESKIIAQDESSYPPNGLHQGGMVQLKDGSWWFIIMQDRGPIGRVPNLEPVVWEEGWPMLGKNGNGKGVEVDTKPYVGKTYPITVPATSDEFNTPSLGLQWQWNHNPDNTKWSLTEREGYLRLHASFAKDLTTARNTLTQRVQGPVSEGTVEMDLAGLKDGNVAGFGIFQSPYAYIAVRKDGNEKTLEMVNEGKVVDSIHDFRAGKIWIKAVARQKGFIVDFSYSVNGKSFIPFGDTFKMNLGYPWTGNRFALFNFSTKKEGVGGYADFNWFRFSGAGSDNVKDRISYNGDCMKIDGNDIFIYSGAFHYFRVPKPLWSDRLAKIKAAGLNTVETYIPWNIHELNMPENLQDQSQFDFRDLKDFLKMALDEFGLYVIVRPGPFICAEWAGGGYPRWLAKYKPAKYPDGFWLRSDDPVYIQWSKHWFDAVDKVLVQYQIINRSPGSKGVIMEQIENEYNAQSAKNKAAALRTFYWTVRNAGINIPVFTCLTNECRGSKDDVLKHVFDAENLYVGLKEAPGCAQRIEGLKQQQPNAPAFVSELQGGWFSLTNGSLSEDNYSDHRHYQAIALMATLGGATGLNTYMFVGGTNFAGWGARGQTTTYDYNAPVHENGGLSKKYEVAKNIGSFIHTYEAGLIHAKGGLCTLIDGTKSLYGGVRVSPDGTKFVFLHNTDPERNISGKITLVPGTPSSTNDPVYNIDQNGKKVLIKTGAVNTGTSLFKPLPISYQLNGLGSKVLVIPVGKNPEDGTWWFGDEINVPAKEIKPVHIRIASGWKRNEDYNVKWRNATQSLPEMGVNDCRYVLYRSSFSLQAKEVKMFARLLFNTYSRDIINVQINGKLAPRLSPSEQYAAEATRNLKNSFRPIKDNDFDNAFDVTGLLKQGKNQIIALYENIGHEHGYVPMEELCGIKTAGLSDTLSEIKHKLDWQVSANVSGVENQWMKEKVNRKNWVKAELDTVMVIPRKGNNIQPKGKHDALMTWYRTEFEIPKPVGNQKALWRLLINASGNGYIYLNGHNLGRHWEVGPQREYYLPECWLNNGNGKRNVLAVGLCQTVNGGEIKAMEVATY